MIQLVVKATVKKLHNQMSDMLQLVVMIPKTQAAISRSTPERCRTFGCAFLVSESVGNLDDKLKHVEHVGH